MSSLAPARDKPGNPARGRDGAAAWRPLSLDALVDRLAGNADFPSLGVAVARVAVLVESDTSTVGDLANLILADVHLTQKVLRLANSVTFRRAAPPVTTMSKAIARIGSEQIRLIAISALLLERMADRRQAAVLSPELGKALYASMLAHAIGPRVGADAEEAAICAMFRSIGRLMVAMYETDAFDAVQALVHGDGGGEGDAAIRVLGAPFEEIGQRILERWGIPDAIAKTVAVCAPCAVLPAGRSERLQLVSQFATAVAVSLANGDVRGRGCTDALAAYGRALRLDAPALAELLAQTAERTRFFSCALDLEPVDVTTALAATAADALPDIEFPQAVPAPPCAVDAATPEGKPHDAVARLLAGLQDMTNGVAEGGDVASALAIATETLQQALGYQRALVCLREPATDAFRARMAFGFMPRERLRRFAFPGTVQGDLFWSVLLRNVDVHIRDRKAGAIEASLPAWYRDACPDAASFVLLPIVVKDRPQGFFYADRAGVDPAGLTAEELALVRMLKSQTLVALRGAARG